MRVYLFFFSGLIVSTKWSYNVAGGLILTEIKSSSVPFLSNQKIGGHLGHLPRSFFPKSTDQNFEITTLFSIVEKHNDYVFGADLLPDSPRGRGSKLQALTSVYIQ